MPTPRTVRRGSARQAPKKKSNQGPLLMAAGGGVVLIVLLIVLLKGGGDEPTPDASGANASGTNAAATNAPAPVTPPTPVVEAPPAPKEPPLPNAATLKKKIKTAANAVEAATLARDADRLKDAKLSEECWTRVFELDANHEEAKKKLDVRQLRPGDDLPGFSALAGTPQQLHLQRFRDAARAELPKAARAALIAEWEVARKEIEARAAKAKTEPFFGLVDQLRLELMEKPFFKELQYEMVESKPPYALFVEVSGTPEERAARKKAVEDGYTPYLEAYDQKIRDYLVPLAPKPPENSLFLPVFVFLNEQRYRDYQMADRGDPGSPGMRAHYEPWKKQSFTWSTVIKPGLGAFESGIQTLMHELTHAWVDQLASKDGGESRAIGVLATHWFSEGIAEYLSFHFREFDKSIRFQPWRSGRLAETGRQADWRVGLQRALGLRLHGLDGLAAGMVSNLEGERRQGAMVSISSGFYADMSNFILWLNFPAPNGAGRAAEFEAYARAELAGEGGEATFKRCFPGLLEESGGLDAKVDEFVLKIASGKINPYKEMNAAGKGGS